MSIAKHYETGESIPEDAYLKLLAARTFRAGSLSLRQVSTIHICMFFIFFFGYFYEYDGSYSTISMVTSEMRNRRYKVPPPFPTP